MTAGNTTARTSTAPGRPGTIAGALKAGEVLEFGAFEIRFAKGILTLSCGDEAELQIMPAMADRVAIHGTTRGAIMPIIREDITHGSRRRDARRPAGAEGTPPAARVPNPDGSGLGCPASPERPLASIGPGGDFVHNVYPADLSPAAQEEPGNVTSASAAS